MPRKPRPPITGRIVLDAPIRPLGLPPAGRPDLILHFAEAQSRAAANGRTVVTFRGPWTVEGTHG